MINRFFFLCTFTGLVLWIILLYVFKITLGYLNVLSSNFESIEIKFSPFMNHLLP